MINNINDYAHITSAATTQVYSGACTLVAIVVGSTANGTVTVIDSVNNATPVVSVLKASLVEGTYVYNITMSTGLKIATTASPDLTIVYRVH